jgi:hypothetical protein
MLKIYGFVLELIKRLRTLISVIERKDRDLGRAASALHCQRGVELGRRAVLARQESVGAVSLGARVGARDDGVLRSG